MGKAFVGLADDINAIFLNPAGLAQLKTWQVTSMSTRLLNTIDYLSFAGTYNTNYGTFGLGYVGASLSGSYVTAMELGSSGDIIIPIASEEAISYNSSVIILAYGNEAKKILDFDFLKNVSVGASFKLFSQGLSGGGISDGVISGYDMDIGLLYKPISWLSIGWDQIDALPVSMGGKLSNSAGEHSLPTTTKLGFAFQVLGENGIYSNPQPLTYLLDFDYMPTRSNYPTLYRTGVEWWPSNYLALRFGLDQDIIGKSDSSGIEVETNPAFGAGVLYNGFKFDYAYHKYGALSENETSYISLSYASPAFIPPPPKKVILREYLTNVTPKDKFITHDEAVVIKGELTDVGAVTSLLINDQIIPYATNGTFEATYPLVLGKNSFLIKVLQNDKVLATTEVRVLRLASFKDVPEGYWAKEAIEYLATIGIIGGYPDGTFRPDKIINRAELTTLLVKAKGFTSAESTDTIFSDVRKKHWASFYIQNGVDLGLVTGYPDKTFRPAKSLNRAEGVTILSRFAELKEPETLIEGPFPDVPGRHWAAKSITAARNAGMLTFLIEKPFEPAKEMPRSEAAEVLSKAQFASTKINSLKNFD
jgi:hypothetical protein